jgi:DNA-binding MarR family transcriptional regulator
MLTKGETRVGREHKPYDFGRRQRLPLTDRQQLVLDLIPPGKPQRTAAIAGALGISRDAVGAATSSLALRGLIQRYGVGSWVRL